MYLEIEKHIKEITKLKKDFHFSLDIYYNDIDDTFVVKLSNLTFDNDNPRHFRNKKLLDSILDAHSFLVDYKNDNNNEKW